MERFITCLLVLLLWLPQGSYAQTPATDVILDQTHGNYRVVATIAPNPPTIGKSTIRIRVTDAQTGAPKPVSAIILLVSAKSVGQPITVIAPQDQTQLGKGIYITERLNFPTSDTWNIIYRISAPDENFELNGDVFVKSVYGNIARAAMIAVPATLIAIGLAFLGYRMWRKRLV